MKFFVRDRQSLNLAPPMSLIPYQISSMMPLTGTRPPHCLTSHLTGNGKDVFKTHFFPTCDDLQAGSRLSPLDVLLVGG